MSFILDALKKSELERQRQSVPGLMDARPPPRNKQLPLWAAALCALLAVNLLVLTFVLTRKSAPAAQVARAPGPEAQAAAQPDAEHFSPLDPAPVYAPEIPVEESSAAPAPPPAPPAARPPARPARHADPLLTDEDAKADNLEVLPSISEINLTGAQALPELHLDVHVYSTRPAERFVYINMRKYHEGATLVEGPIVERVRRDGVVLNYQGLRFILPRQP